MKFTIGARIHTATGRAVLHIVLNGWELTVNLMGPARSHTGAGRWSW
jgi:hypothetical protein